MRVPFLLAVSLLTFLPFLGGRDIVTSHEARVVQTSRQMAESGWPWNAAPVSVPRVELSDTPEGRRLLPRGDGATMSVNPWVVPVMNGQIRLQKPPLPYWCTAVLYRLFGYSAFTSRIIPALMGALSVLLVWDLARMLLGRVGAWYAGLVWVSSYFIIDEFRKSMADPYLAFLTLVSMWAWIRASRPAPARTHRPGTLCIFYIALALGILAKGPIIFAFLGVILIAYHIFHRARLPGKWWMHGIGLVVLLVISLPWPIAILRGVPNAMEIWRYESIGALTDKIENARPWWFYAPNLLLIVLPWTPLWVMGLIKPLKFPRQRRWFLPAATIGIVLIFSCSFSKKNAYLLPLMPLAAIASAQGLRWLTLIPRRRTRTTAARVALAAVTFSVLIQVFLSAFVARQDNARSPRDAAALVTRMLAESPGSSILYSRLPDEVTAYLPLNVRESPHAADYLLIADDRKGLANTYAHSIETVPAGRVEWAQPVTIPNSAVSRWKVYRLTVSPIQRPAPGPG